MLLIGKAASRQAGLISKRVSARERRKGHFLWVWRFGNNSWRISKEVVLQNSAFVSENWLRLGLFVSLLLHRLLLILRFIYLLSGLGAISLFIIAGNSKHVQIFLSHTSLISQIMKQDHRPKTSKQPLSFSLLLNCVFVPIFREVIASRTTFQLAITSKI